MNKITQAGFGVMGCGCAMVIVGVVFMLFMALLGLAVAA